GRGCPSKPALVVGAGLRRYPQPLLGGLGEAQQADGCPYPLRSKDRHRVRRDPLDIGNGITHLAMPLAPAILACNNRIQTNCARAAVTATNSPIPSPPTFSLA